MRATAVIILLFTNVVLIAQNITIPDANFKNALVNDLVVDTNGDGILDSDADFNDDGEIQLSEAQSILYLEVNNKNIASIEGIENFTGLVLFACYENQISSIDMSQSPNLEFLFCNDNVLTNINITSNPALLRLWCFDNSLSTIDTSANQNLEEFVCSGNQLTELDVSGNISLHRLNCEYNQLTALDITQNPNLTDLNCHYNQLSVLDISQNPLLFWLSCRNNNLTGLDTSQNALLYVLGCSANQITELDVSNNTSLYALLCSSNQLTSLDVSQNISLERLSCSSNQLHTLDVSMNSVLTLLSCRQNSLVNLNIKNGNNVNMYRMWSNDNPNLLCIQVDDPEFSETADGWIKDPIASYNTECILGIEESYDSSVVLYPNPASESIFVDSKLAVDMVTIYNMQGDLVLKSYHSKIDIAFLSSGMYFVYVEIGNNKSVHKIIKQ